MRLVPVLRKVSIPFIAGQWSLHEKTLVGALQRALVSIPFIAGQWSLHAAYLDEPPGWRLFQSPSLRGSGRFVPNIPHQGQEDRDVSIPFIAGQWSLRASGAGPQPGPRSFNPLHCGAVVASPRLDFGLRARLRVSIPFIAGQWSLPLLNPSFL